MSFRSIVRDLKDGMGSLSRRGFEFKHSIQNRKFQSSIYELQDPSLDIQQSCWANLPPELLCDLIKRLESSESNWPGRKHVVACAAVCRSWRAMCKEIIRSPEFCGKLTFPVSLKQPGPRDGTIQCFIKRDKYKMMYHLYLCLSPAFVAVVVENGKFLLSAKRSRHTTFTEYKISMEVGRISRSCNSYIGKLRSNFLGTKYIIYEAQPPYNADFLCPQGRSSRRFNSKKVSPKVPTGNYNIAQLSYELNVLGTRSPRRMHCIMYSIPHLTDHIVTHSLEDSFRSLPFSKNSIMNQQYLDFNNTLNNSRIQDIKQQPLILHNKAPRWHEQLQCWCLNFRGRVTVASVKNFQLVAANHPAAGAPTPSLPAQSDHDKVILQFGKVSKDMFTMDYRYPLSAFQAFAICLSSFDAKLACE